MADQETFRREIAGWLEQYCPATMRSPYRGEEEWVWGGKQATFWCDDARLWLQRMVARGLVAPAWPREFGGAGFSAEHASILDEEMKRLGCREPVRSLGLWMLGPVLLKFGSDEQKRAHLPPIARGEIRWCQGYSEPGAGSDLASLQTRAVLDGSEYVVNGQKVWTSYADKADWMFCLVRTDPHAAKHAGISFLLIDMATPGVTTRPIKLISGRSPFCETFFSDVRVPAQNLVGKSGDGWTIAKSLLEHERALMSRARDQNADEEGQLDDLARQYVGVSDGRILDAVLRDRITQINMDLLCNRLTMKRSAETVAAGWGSGPESSMFKYYGTELGKRRRELMVEIAGFRGLGWEDAEFSQRELSLTRNWLRSRASSIEGGTSEIQLNIIAKRVLGLPD